MPKISIIVPVYKAEKFLKRCVDSILAQSFSDFELILVDDGSPDNCGAICDAYAEKDKRIKVIHKENEGASSARNVGLDKASGEWIGFIDSDDWVHKDYLLYLYNAAVDNNKLISVSGFIPVTEYVNDIICSYDFSIKKSADSLYYKNNLMVAPWAKLYKRELWNNTRFINGMLAEDFFIVPEIMLKASDVAVLDANLYHYYIDNFESLMHSKTKSLKFYNDNCLGYEKNIGLFKKYNDEEHMADFISRYFNYNLWSYNDVKSTGDKKFKKITKNRCYSILRKYKKYFDFTDKDFEWNLCQLSPSFSMYVNFKNLFLKIKR